MSLEREVAEDLHAAVTDDMYVTDIVRDAIQRLDPIGDRSDSYPYLALARKMRVEYGDVLHYVQFIDNGYCYDPVLENRPMEEALERLTNEQCLAIFERHRELHRA